MGGVQKPVQIASYIIIGIGVILFALNIFMRGSVNVALPLVFLVLGGGFFILVSNLRERWNWATFLYAPGALLTAFGIIFLLNVLTNDWNSWAYAWLFLVAAIGIGLILANHDNDWPQVISVVGWSLAIGGITFFAIFGVITGGLLIQVIAPILLIAAGLSLRWVHLDKVLSSSILQRLHVLPAAKSGEQPASTPDLLVEPLSAREIEVLRLIDLGLSNQQIADKLSVATSTIKTHINNIYGKLGVQTRVQALNRARELKLLDE
ncbi:MAG TPA: response regulator transcription factor [Anaerolineaceae bacterium]